MTIELNTKAIRGLTRLALPADDGYIYRLGVALYGFASLSSFMAELAHHMDPHLISEKGRSRGRYGEYGPTVSLTACRFDYDPQ